MGNVQHIVISAYAGVTCHGSGTPKAYKLDFYFFPIHLNTSL